MKLSWIYYPCFSPQVHFVEIVSNTYRVLQMCIVVIFTFELFINGHHILTYKVLQKTLLNTLLDLYGTACYVFMDQLTRTKMVLCYKIELF